MTNTKPFVWALFLCLSTAISLAQTPHPVCWNTPLPAGISITNNTYSISATQLITAKNTLATDNGFVTMDLESLAANHIYWIGLAEEAPQANWSWKDFTYSIGIDAYGTPATKHVYNKGTWKAGFSNLQQGDQLKISIANGQVSFAMNEAVFYTQAAIHSQPLQLMAYFVRLSVNGNELDYTAELDIKASVFCGGNPVPDLNVFLNKTDATGGQNNGRIIATISGGIPPYNLSWSNGVDVNNTNQTSHNLNNLAPGDYQVSVSSSDGQIVTSETVTINGSDVSPLEVSVSKTDATTGQNNGSITATISGGIPPYNLSWSNGVDVNNTNETIHRLDNLAPGEYGLEVTSSDGQSVFAPVVNIEEQTLSICGNTILSDCSDDAPFLEKNLGEPQTIVIPPNTVDVYGGRMAPSFREMLGSNFIITNTFELPHLDNLTDIFSYPRLFVFHNKDYWDDGIGEPVTEDKKRIIRPREIERLKLVVNSNNHPFSRGSFQLGDKMISIDPNTGDFQEIVITNENIFNYSSSQQNTFTNYMNINYRYVLEYYNKFKKEQNNNPNHPYIFKGIVATLTVVNANFPSNIFADYGFPANWWKREDWGADYAEIKCSAKAYAKMFARTYAPKEADCSTCERLVDVLEIGNEPWAYEDPTTYQAIVEGFAEGMDEYYQSDNRNKIHLQTAAFQAQHQENTSTPNAGDYFSWKDYIGARISPDYKCYLEGINLHPYSNQLSDGTGFFRQRLLAHPEQIQANGNADSKFLYTKNAWKWVEDNMPLGSRNLHLSEFGWDSQTNNACPNDGSGVGIGEAAQGIYIIRSLLMMGRFGVNRAMLFETVDDPFLNGQCIFAYHSSGIWNTGPNNGAIPKNSQKILQKFIEVAGNSSFYHSLKENDEGVYAYALGIDGQPTHLVSWFSTNINNMNWATIKNKSITSPINLQIDGKPYQVDAAKNWYYLDDQININGTIKDAQPLSNTDKNDVFLGNNMFKLRPVPVLIPILQSGDPCQDNQAPLLTCPSNITQTQSGARTIVNWNLPTVTDDCDFNPNLNGTHQSGDSFPLGTTTVIYTATDNTGKTGTCSFDITIEEETGEPEEYCSSSAEQPWERWIEKIELASIDNRSGKQASQPVGYGDFLSLSTTLTKGNNYPLKLTPGYSWPGDPNHDLHWRVWIDFNGDGDFNDGGEQVFETQNNLEVNATIQIPSTAQTGNTRMRISLKKGGFPTPCELIQLGEVEDYTINIESLQEISKK